MNKRIYLCLAHINGNEMKFIQEAFDTNWVVPLGPNVNGSEKDLEGFVGENKRVVALSSGTDSPKRIPCFMTREGMWKESLTSLLTS